MTAKTVASALQVVGLALVAFFVALANLTVGGVLGGVFVVLIGVALERR